MNNNKILISIIMPVYNSEKYVSTCIDSIMEQNFVDFELLLIDDGSSDASAIICDEYAAKDSRIRVFHKENGGICDARNLGLKEARGEYIAFSDHDDIVAPGFLKENYFLAKKHNADIVKFGRESLVLRNEKIVYRDVRIFKNKILKRKDVIENYLQLRFSGAMTCVWDGLFRKQFLLDNKICFDTQYKKGGEDVDFCSNCFACAEKVVMSKKIHYIHYIRMGYSTSTKYDENKIAKLECLIDNLDVCMERLDLTKENNAELYALNIIKEQVYPALRYFKQLNYTTLKAEKYLKLIYDKRKIPQCSAISLYLYSKKWGLYTLLFIKKHFKIMYWMLKLKKEGQG